MTDSILTLIGIAEDLAFDDSPVLPKDGLPRDPTPANALRLWRERADRSPQVVAAVAAIVAADPECVADKEINDLETWLTKALGTTPELDRRSLQLARCMVLIRNKDYPLALELLDSLVAHDESARDNRRRLELRIEILEGLGQVDEADRLRRSLKIDDLLDANVPSLELREQALSLFKESYCAEAERIYLHLVKRGFELGSTYCHLARVCLMLDRFDDAFRHLDVAEQHCRERSYVRARAIFLRILECYLNQHPTGRLLAQLRQTLSEPGAFEDWTMEPVVDHLKTRERFTAAQIEILMILISVVSSVTNLPQLDRITNLDIAAPKSGS